MSFREYLHERAEESRHNETLAYLMFVAGTIFVVGGLLVTLSFSSELEWFLIIPYCAGVTAGTFLSVTLLISGVSMMLFGLGSGIIYSGDRNWYMQEMRKADSPEENPLIKEKTKKNIPRKIKETS